MMKLRDNAGFSLAETLLAILILLLVSTIVTVGAPVAANAYDKVIRGANAKVLLSTAISSLRNEIATARNLSVDKVHNTISYYSADKGATSEISHDETTWEIMIEEYTDLELAGVAKDPKHSLISSQAATGDLYVTYDEVESMENAVRFPKLAVYRRSDTEHDNPLASVDNFVIRIIKPVETTSESGDDNI